MPPIFTSMKNNQRLVLDENILMGNKILRKKLGFINSTQIVDAGTCDEKLLEKCLKRKLIIVTKDIRFTLNTVLQGHEIIFQDHEGTRHFISGIQTKIIDVNCNKKFHDEVTLHILTSGDVILP